MREVRVKALGELATALLDGRLPERDVCIFIGSAVSAWLAGGGSLERDYFCVKGTPGSHTTPAALWQRLQDEADNAPPREDGNPQTDNP